MNFDPLAWAAVGNMNLGHAVKKEDAPLTTRELVANPIADDELAKARAVTDELLRMGANIAESYEDFLHLGFALADGLGPDGRDLYHRLCSQSAKYREADCEKKWQECLSKRDGRVTIKTFYKMAQDAGVDLSAIGRRFPSTPPLRHGSVKDSAVNSESVCSNTQMVENNHICLY